MIRTTYSEARANFKRYLDQAADDRETIIVRRRGKEDVAIIAADELASLEATAYLLRSPVNAARLLAALDESRRGENRVELSPEELRRWVDSGVAPAR
jgi:antitoxin YefM